MPELTNNELWGDDLPNQHKHICMICGNTYDCNLPECKNNPEGYDGCDLIFNDKQV